MSPSAAAAKAGKRDVESLAPIDGLPAALRLLAEAVIYSPVSSSDHLLVLADALDELASFAYERGLFASSDVPLCSPALALADELRRRAPAYA